MTMTRNVLAVTALCTLLGPLSACSGSDSDGPSSSSSASSSGSSSASPSGTGVTDREKKSGCTATVELTGAVEASWSGKATAAKSKGRGVSYSTSSKDGSTTVAVLPKQKTIPATPVVTADGTSYTAQSGKGTSADPKGKGATVDADAVVLVDGKQKTVHVVAEFDC